MSAEPKAGRLMTAKASPGRGGELAAAMLEVAGGLRGFPGCEVYLVSQDRADPDTVFVMEVWSDQAAVDAALEAARTAPAVSIAEVLAMLSEPARRGRPRSARWCRRGYSGVSGARSRGWGPAGSVPRPWRWPGVPG